jgi:prephenate dehydrogenase
MNKPRIALVGCGFVGTALGLALKAELKDVEIVGHDKDRDAMRRAESLKAIDKGEWNLPAACDSAALALIAIPPDGVELTLKSIAPVAPARAIIATVGGLTSDLFKLARQYVPGEVEFISTSIVFHPDRVSASLAPDQAQADSVKDAIWTITPRPGTSPEAVDMFASLVMQLGAKPLFVDVVERDGLAMAVDVLPPVFGSALMLAVSGDMAWRERRWMAGASFGDSVAGVDRARGLSSALLSQPDTAVYWLNQVMLQCMALRDAIQAGEADAVQKLLDQATERRDEWLATWRRGRDEGRPPVEGSHSVLSMFVGERLAQRVSGKGDAKRK